MTEKARDTAWTLSGYSVGRSSGWPAMSAAFLYVWWLSELSVSVLCLCVFVNNDKFAVPKIALFVIRDLFQLTPLSLR